jgi:hypothetical protein
MNWYPVGTKVELHTQWPWWMGWGEVVEVKSESWVRIRLEDGTEREAPTYSANLCYSRRAEHQAERKAKLRMYYWQRPNQWGNGWHTPEEAALMEQFGFEVREKVEDE